MPILIKILHLPWRVSRIPIKAFFTNPVQPTLYYLTRCQKPEEITMHICSTWASTCKNIIPYKPRLEPLPLFTKYVFAIVTFYMKPVWVSHGYRICTSASWAPKGCLPKRLQYNTAVQSLTWHVDKTAIMYCVLYNCVKYKLKYGHDIQIWQRLMITCFYMYSMHDANHTSTWIIHVCMEFYKLAWHANTHICS